MFFYFFLYVKILLVISMEELYEKLYKLKDDLDKLDLFKDLERAYNKVNENEELISKIDKYNQTKDNNLRIDIYNYEEIKEYKRLENEVNLLIFSINSKLKKINNERSCIHENH